MAIDAVKRVLPTVVAEVAPLGQVRYSAADLNTPSVVPFAPRIVANADALRASTFASARHTASISQLGLRTLGGQPVRATRVAYAPQNKIAVGARVECRIRGEVVLGTYIGVDYNGLPCIDTGAPIHRIGTWKGLGVFDPKPNPACVDELTVYPASAVIRTEIEKALDTPVVGMYTVRAYLKSFAVRDQQAWLIGGMVRDILGADAKGEPLPASHDIDLAVAASPCAVRTALRAVAYDLPERGIYSYRDTEQHGTIQLGKFKAGLDVTSLKVRTTRKRTTSPDAPGKILRNVFGGSLLADARLRDFHFNALYYDTEQHAILDPTGKGYDAAISKTLSFIDADRADALMALRYFKFRVRGFGTNDDTKRDLHAIMERTWIADQLASVCHRGIPGWGNSIELRNYVTAMRRVAQADGVGDLFESRLVPLFE